MITRASMTTLATITATDTVRQAKLGISCGVQVPVESA